MPFSSDIPYGTDSAVDDLALPTSPPITRTAKGGSYTAFLLINGPLTVRQRSQIEAVVRTIGEQGEVFVVLTFQDNGGTIETDVTVANFTDGIRVASAGAGVVTVDIPPNGITEDMLTNAIVTAAKLANDSVTTAKILDAAVTPAKLSQAYLPLTDIIPIYNTGINLGTGIAINYNVSTSVPVSLAAGTYVYILMCSLHGEGSGALVDGNLRIQMDGVTLTQSGTIRMEAGVDTPATLMEIDTFTLGGPDASVTFTYDWLRVGGTINMRQADFAMLLLKVA